MVFVPSIISEVFEEATPPYLRLCWNYFFWGGANIKFTINTINTINWEIRIFGEILKYRGEGSRVPGYVPGGDDGRTLGGVYSRNSAFRQLIRCGHNDGFPSVWGTPCRWSFPDWQTDRLFFSELRWRAFDTVSANTNPYAVERGRADFVPITGNDNKKFVAM